MTATFFVIPEFFLEHQREKKYPGSRDKMRI
jgi:hypothetical protein